MLSLKLGLLTHQDSHPGLFLLECIFSVVFSKIYNAVLLTIVVILYIGSPCLIYNCKFLLLNSFYPFTNPQTPTPGNHQYVPIIYKLGSAIVAVSGFHIEVKPYSVCFFLPDLFYLAQCPQSPAHPCPIPDGKWNHPFIFSCPGHST